MAAATKDRPQRAQVILAGGPPMNVAASTKIYGGTLMANNGSGAAIPAVDTAARPVVGVCLQQADNSGGAAGDKKVSPQLGIFEFDHSGLTENDRGKNVFVSDDQTVTNAATATNDQKVGTLMGLVGGKARVFVGVFAPTDA